jgi:sugar transferase EpsL
VSAVPERERFVIRLGFLKRLADVVLSAAALPVVLPLFAVTWCAVRLALGRPVFFVAARAGKDGRPIRILKFRSMRDAAGPDGRPLPDAQRLGAFGRWLRRSSLDELPQVLSVLSGDMSLVGPRPLPLEYVARYSDRQATRLLVRPGLTGWAQIHGRNAVDWPQRLEYDARYVDMLTTWWWPLIDLRIIAVTAVQVLWQAVTGRGVAAPGTATMREFVP